MNLVTTLRRLAHAASAGVVLVCLVTIWMTFIHQPTDSSELLAAGQIRYLALLLAGVLVVAWLGKARRNLLAFKGEERAYSPGWTIGAWLIPIGNLIMPALVTADIAKGSTTDPQTRRKLLTLMWVWWACYLGNAVAVFGAFNPDIADLAQIMGGTSYIAAGVLLIMLMYKITDAQRERFSAVTEPNPADFPTFTVDDVQAADAG
jgi:uncharacterized protein DUF4328